MTMLDESTFINSKGQIKVEIKDDMIYIYFSTDYTNPKEVYNANEIGKAKKYMKDIANLTPNDKRELEILFGKLSLSEKVGQENEDIDRILMRYTENFELFHDTKKQCYAKIPFEDHDEIYAINSKEFSSILRKKYLEEYQSVVKNQELDNVIQTISAIAEFKGKEYKLYVRICKYEGAIWFDLGNWKAVKITENGWEIINRPPILFKHFSNQKAYDFEIKKDGNAKDIFKLIRLNHDNQAMLYLIDLCTKFIPDIQHVAVSISGDAGSGKSTKCQIQKRLVDWCENDFIRMSKNLEELIQNMSHTYYAIFDNLSYLTGDQSDLLATAVTGTSGARRVLYEQDSDFIYTFKLCIGMTGINVVVNRPDLIERTINFEEGKTDKYMSETEFWQLFEELKGSILGGIFNSIVIAMKYKNQINIKRDCRMVDFIEWGSAISVALGYTQEDFIEAYAISCSKLNENLLENNTTGRILIKFMDNKQEWEGNMEKLLTELKMIGALLGFEKGSGVPNSPISLSKKYNELRNNLEKIGIYKEDINKSERKFKLINKKYKEQEQTEEMKEIINKQNEDKLKREVIIKEMELKPWLRCSCMDENGEQTRHCTDCDNHKYIKQYEKYKESLKIKPIEVVELKEEIYIPEIEEPEILTDAEKQMDKEAFDQLDIKEEIYELERKKWEHEVIIPDEIF